MSHASNTMTNKLARETAAADASDLDSFVADGFDIFIANRRYNTASAFIGGAIGVVATALSPRATPLTIGISAGVALINTAGVYVNHPLHEHIATSKLDAAAIGLTKASVAAGAGALANFILGKELSPEDEIPSTVDGDTNDTDD